MTVPIRVIQSVYINVPSSQPEQPLTRILFKNEEGEIFFEINQLKKLQYFKEFFNENPEPEIIDLSKLNFEFKPSHLELLIQLIHGQFESAAMNFSLSTEADLYEKLRDQLLYFEPLQGSELYHKFTFWIPKMTLQVAKKIHKASTEFFHQSDLKKIDKANKICAYSKLYFSSEEEADQHFKILSKEDRLLKKLVLKHSIALKKANPDLQLNSIQQEIREQMKKIRSLKHRIDPDKCDSKFFWSLIESADHHPENVVKERADYELKKYRKLINEAIENNIFGTNRESFMPHLIGPAHYLFKYYGLFLAQDKIKEFYKNESLFYLNTPNEDKRNNPDVPLTSMQHSLRNLNQFREKLSFSEFTHDYLTSKYQNTRFRYNLKNEDIKDLESEIRRDLEKTIAFPLPERVFQICSE